MHPFANESTADRFQSQLRSLEKALRRLVRTNDLRSKAIAKACGLTAAQLVVCRGVQQLGEVTSTALSAYADLSPATVVTILDNLEERGIIQRYRSTSDRRVVHTRLTETGAAMIAKAPPAFSPEVSDLLAALPAARRARIVADVTALADLLSRTGARAELKGGAGTVP